MRFLIPIASGHLFQEGGDIVLLASMLDVLTLMGEEKPHVFFSANWTISSMRLRNVHFAKFKCSAIYT